MGVPASELKSKVQVDEIPVYLEQLKRERQRITKEDFYYAQLAMQLNMLATLVDAQFVSGNMPNRKLAWENIKQQTIEKFMVSYGSNSSRPKRKMTKAEFLKKHVNKEIYHKSTWNGLLGAPADLKRY